jgi:phosphate transport system permease protein
VTTVTAETGSPKRRLGDLVFANITRAAGIAILLALAGVAIFLTAQGLPALGATSEDLKGHSNLLTYVAPLVFGTLLAAVIALAIAVPLALGVALSVSHYAPKSIAVAIGYLVDLLAAVPSVVYGLWGIAVLAPAAQGFYGDVHGWVKPIPVLNRVFGPDPNGRSLMTAGVILAIMITPIITSLTREVFATVPRGEKDAALALGATRWEMIRTAVFPHSFGGMTGAVMLGLGRAMGETIAVALVIGSSPQVVANLFKPGDAMPAVIANQFGESGGTFRAALMGLGVALFVITILINMSARFIVGRAEVRLRGVA